MKSKAAGVDISLLRRGIFFFCLLAVLPCFADPLLIEHFDVEAPDNSPIGGAPGWHAYATTEGGLTDYTATAPSGLYPSLSHSLPGVGTHGPGYLVMGSGTVVSNVFVWLECPTNLDQRAIASINFYSKNDLPTTTERVVVRIDKRWFATTQLFHDVSSNSVWSVNALLFGTNAGAWRNFNTNTLALGAELATPLPKGDVTAIGFFGQNLAAGKIRIDAISVESGPIMDSNYLVGSWIWGDNMSDRQTCRFWRTIEIPQGVTVTRARLRLTADNSYRAFFDGTEIVQGSEWRRLTEFDLTLWLSPGTHVLAIEAFNEVSWAGLVAGVVVETDNGRVIRIPSDSTWKVVPPRQRGWMTRQTPRAEWRPAKVSYQFGDLPGYPKNPVVLPAALSPVVTHFWQRGWFQITLLSFCVIVVVICLRLLARLTVQSKAQQLLQRERARIARDIHDDLGAGLTHLVLLGETAQKELAGDAKACTQFERISEVGRKLVGAIDEVVWTVNSQRDSLRDFEIYICRYAENFLRARSIRCRLDVDDEIPQINFDLATRRSLFLAIKEILNNITKHSGATEVSLGIHVDHQTVHVTIADNGKGFDFSTRDMSRNGLTNMAQRMAELGGGCKVTSKPGAGCSIELHAQLGGNSQRLRWRWRNKSQGLVEKSEVKIKST